MTRERLAATAFQLFLDKGYDSTTVEDITEAADLSPGTFYLHFSSKSDVAMVRFDEWLEMLVDLLAQRPLDESPEEMLAPVLRELQDGAYGHEVRQDQVGQAIPPVPVALLLSEASNEVAGRFHRSIMTAFDRITAELRRRMQSPPGSLEPRILAGAYVAALFVAVRGFGDAVEVPGAPVHPTELALTAVHSYMDGARVLWDASRAGDSVPASAPDPASGDGGQTPLPDPASGDGTMEERDGR